MKNTATITWKSIVVDVAKIKPTPINYKIRTALGYERLKTSLKKFGLAGTVVCNTDLTLIDGNSRLEQEKEKGTKRMTVSVPNRKLTPQEFKEMSAMFDFAKVGSVDEERINGDLGKTRDFYEKWNLTVPKKLLDKVGKAQVQEYQDNKQSKKKVKKAEKVSNEQNLNDIVVVQLFFSNKQSDEFRKHEERLLKKFKLRSTTELVLKLVQITK